MKVRLPGILLSSLLFIFFSLMGAGVSGQTDTLRQGEPLVRENRALRDSVADLLSRQIKIYPIPAKSELIAENIEGITMIEIFDVTGNKRINEVCDNHSQVTIEVSTLKKGIYFIRFISPGATVMKRFIKE